MRPRHYRNLVPDSPLHRQLEHLLRENWGRVSVATVCEEVMQLVGTEPDVGRVLVETLIEDDFRMRLDGDGMVEWAEPEPQELWQACRRFAVVDVETTNGGREAERIIEIGVAVVEAGRVAREWDALVNPNRSIPYWVQQLTGISEAMVQAAPRFEEVAPRLLDDLEEAILVAHHARFDVGCLNAEFSRWLGQRPANPYLCTVELSRRFLPGSDNYRLETLSQWLRLTHERPHRAGSDARATAELFCHMLGSVEAPWHDYLRPRSPRARAAKIVETKPPVLS